MKTRDKMLICMNNFITNKVTKSNIRLMKNEAFNENVDIMFPSYDNIDNFISEFTKDLHSYNDNSEENESILTIINNMDNKIITETLYNNVLSESNISDTTEFCVANIIKPYIKNI